MRRIALVQPRHFCAIVVALVLALALMLPSSSPLARSEASVDPFADGGLMLRGKGATDALPAMRLGTDMKAHISGATARVTVTQAFRNTSSEWMEATYLFPLPDNGAVDSLNIVAGDRILVGMIKERQEAREIYEKAASEGRKAGLIEQARPNMFRSNVANVGPGETVLVQFTFQAPVRQLGDEYALRLPLVVAPRYVARSHLSSLAGVLDAAQITAPTATPSIAEGLNPVSISVDLAPGFEPANIASPYHPIDISGSGASRKISLTSGHVPADRDFELRWSNASGQPQLGLFTEAFNGLNYVMVTLTPPASPAGTTIPPREMIFVIDNSGSMSGESMRAARSSLLYALDTLRPQDSFNIIRFDSSMTQLFPSAVPADSKHLRIARGYTEGLRAAGGTEMLPALRAALQDRSPAETGSVRQVIFLTDGSLYNEEAMMAEIAQNRGRSRVFMIGIGSAPNQYLMTRMARAGRGTYANIGMGAEVESKMRSLLDQLSSPIAQNLAVTVDGTPLEFTPADLPDLYAGEPLVLIGRAKEIDGTLTLRGTLNGKAWSQSIDLSQAIPSDAVAKLWARRHVDDVEAQRWSNDIDHELAAAIIAETGLTFSIVTSETSLVAEDVTPSRPEGARLTREELPLLLPHGWDFDALFPASTADSVIAKGAKGEHEMALNLPRTATNYAGTLQSGLALLLLGLLGLALQRRRGRLVADAL